MGFGIKICIGIILVLGLFLAGAGLMIKSQITTIAELNKETIRLNGIALKAQKDLTDVTVAAATATLQSENYQKDISRLEARYDADINDLRGKIEATLAAADRDPDQYGRVAGILLYRSMRNLCRSMGGDARTCSSPVSESPEADGSPVPRSEGKDSSSENTSSGGR